MNVVHGKFKKEFCDKVLELGKEGGSIIDFAVACNTSKNTFLIWMEANEELKEHVNEALTLSQQYWEQKIFTKIVEERNGPKVNTALATLFLKAKFPDEYRETAPRMAVEVVNREPQVLPDGLLSILGRIEEKIRNGHNK